MQISSAIHHSPLTIDNSPLTTLAAKTPTFAATQEKNLSLSSTIRNISAGFLLVVFAFGITPKRTLHNLAAHHKDGKIKASILYVHPVQISKSAFNCQCENLISESPFVSEIHASGVIIPIIFPSYQNRIIETDYSSDLFCFGLRGPPAC